MDRFGGVGSRVCAAALAAQSEESLKGSYLFDPVIFTRMGTDNKPDLEPTIHCDGVVLRRGRAPARTAWRAGSPRWHFGHLTRALDSRFKCQ